MPTEDKAKELFAKLEEAYAKIEFFESEVRKIEAQLVMNRQFIGIEKDELEGV